VYRAKHFGEYVEIAPQVIDCIGGIVSIFHYIGVEKDVEEMPGDEENNVLAQLQ